MLTLSLVSRFLSLSSPNLSTLLNSISLFARTRSHLLPRIILRLLLTITLIILKAILRIGHSFQFSSLFSLFWSLPFAVIVILPLLLSSCLHLICLIIHTSPNLNLSKIFMSLPLFNYFLALFLYMIFSNRISLRQFIILESATNKK